jgi:hypothetical protein
VAECGLRPFPPYVSTQAAAMPPDSIRAHIGLRRPADDRVCIDALTLLNVQGKSWSWC